MAFVMEAPSTKKRHQATEATEFDDVADDFSYHKFKRQRMKKNIELFELNDDCLEHLFRQLPLESLNAINETCHRFNGIVVANNIHKYHSSVTHFDVAAMAVRYYARYMDFRVDYIVGYLLRFGRNIRHIAFDNNGCFEEGEAVNMFFRSIVDNCSNAMKSLEMLNVNLDTVTIAYAHRLFANLNKLQTDSHVKWSEIFPLCVNLNELIIQYDRWLHPFNLNYTFPKLRTFTFTFAIDWDDDDEFIFLTIGDGIEILWLENALDLFFNRHLHLTSLSLTSSYSYNINIIGQLAQLEELYLDGGGQQAVQLSMQPLCHLTNLRKIETKNFLDTDYLQFLRLTESAHTLQHLTIEQFTCNEGGIDGLSRLLYLRYLSLTVIANAGNITDAVWTQLQNLTGLLKLKFTGDSEVGAKLLKHLIGAQRSLRNLSLCIDGLNNYRVAMLAPFVGLEKLKLELSAENYDIYPINWQPICHLTQLKKLILKNIDIDFSGTVQRNLLHNLTSFGTLEKLKISDTIFDAEYIQVIGKFVNLKELKLHQIVNVAAKHLRILGRLSHVRKFSVQLSAAHQDLNMNIADLVDQWPSIEHFQFTEFYPNRHFDIRYLRYKLADILEARDNFRHLTITIGHDSIKIS